MTRPAGEEMVWSQEGKKQFDKRQTIQQKDAKREKDRAKKESNNYRN